MKPFELPTHGEQTKVKPYADPFKKECFKEAFIHIYGSKSLMDEGVRSTITFKNGDTESTQKFKEPDLESILQKMKAFIDSLD